MHADACCCLLPCVSCLQSTWKEFVGNATSSIYSPMRRGSRTASSTKRKKTCTEVAATQVADGWTRMVDGFEIVHKSSCPDEAKTQVTRHGCTFPSSWHPYPRWIRTRDGMSSPHHHRKLPETLEKAKSGCTKVHTTPAAQKQREKPQVSSLALFKKHMIAMVAMDLCQHVCLAEGNRNKNILEHCLVRNPPNIMC